MIAVGCASTPDGTSPDGVDVTPSSSPVASTTPTAGPTATPSTSSSGPSTASVAGDYTSPSCGKRTYARELSLGADGHFTASDLVSPCPPKAVCVWSGIVVRQGTYSTNGASITLVPEGGASGQPGEPLATELALDHGAPVEDPDHSHCVYAVATKTPH